MAKYEISLVGKIDEKKTISAINSALKNISQGTKSVDITLNTDKAKRQVTQMNTYLKNQERNLINDQMKLEAKMSNSKKIYNSVEAQTLKSLLSQKQQQLKLLETEIKDTGVLSEKALKQKDIIDQLNRSISNQKTAVNVLGQQNLTVWDKLTKKAEEYFRYSLAAMTIQQTGQVIHQMVQEVIDLDGALVELRKVTDLEGESLENFKDKAYDAASQVARTGQEMIEASTEFAKSGYNPDDALELGKIALMYGNIADEEVGAGDAASFIIAQMKAFNIEAKDAIHIIDAVNEVSNNFAVSSADIANNLGKASAVVANAGNSMEQYIAMLTAITEITRSADKAANGKKMKPYIYSNMYINIALNPVIPKAYNNYNIRMKYA